jgi:hypothetical protein
MLREAGRPHINDYENNTLERGHPCDHKDRPAVRVSMRRFHQGQGFINNPLIAGYTDAILSLSFVYLVYWRRPYTG